MITFTLIKAKFKHDMMAKCLKYESSALTSMMAFTCAKRGSRTKTAKVTASQIPRAQPNRIWFRVSAFSKNRAKPITAEYRNAAVITKVFYTILSLGVIFDSIFIN